MRRVLIVTTTGLATLAVGVALGIVGTHLVSSWRGAADPPPAAAAEPATQDRDGRNSDGNRADRAAPQGSVDAEPDQAPVDEGEQAATGSDESVARPAVKSADGRDDDSEDDSDGDGGGDEDAQGDDWQDWDAAPEPGTDDDDEAAESGSPDDTTDDPSAQDGAESDDQVSPPAGGDDADTTSEAESTPTSSDADEESGADEDAK